MLEKFLGFCEEYFFGRCHYFIFGAFFSSSLNKISKASLFGNLRKVLIFLSVFKSLALNAGGCLFTNFFLQNATSLLSFSTSFFKDCISFSLANIVYILVIPAAVVFRFHCVIITNTIIVSLFINIGLTRVVASSTIVVYW